MSAKIALLNDVLYESSFESQLYMVYDSNKQLMASGDAFHKKYPMKLDKGDYTLRLHIRHEKVELLERITDIDMTLYIKLNNDVSQLK